MSNQRQHIIEKAAALVHLRGFSNTSVDDILVASQIGKGQFYYYFKSKEDLGYAILDWMLTTWRDHFLAEMFRGERENLAQVNRFLDRMVERQSQLGCRGGCLFGNMALELSDLHEGFRQKINEIFTVWRCELEKALRRGKQFGELVETVDESSLAEFIIASMEGAVLLAKTRKDVGVLRACCENLKRYLAGFSRHPLSTSRGEAGLMH
jgi:TetR/AcrR family transcriptional repressor of nem operon